MLITEFNVTVTHAQVVVFERPPKAYEWTDDHVAQGFLFSPGDVSFGVPDHDGVCRIQIYSNEKFVLDDLCLWAVQIPFEVRGDFIDVGTVSETRKVHIDRDNYNLTFSAYDGLGIDGDCTFLLKLFFSNDTNPSFAIIKNGIGVTTDRVLRVDADEMS
ncbi:competence protein ComJ [Methylobacterium radiotolerans]|uniref:Competence protein J (ComJ) n=1 Tax=Methylobacterium radiotolerans (strain ATCC 27329 / DSM 1819 / JCM 2831 / NBRC 15690 / NCIMB 10815 / 0-1) TaxID=426355 RepID=B1M1Y6_METRJ|nr:competence protein ComJ [Methylobacterium radiotolerans]ACB23171.1 hypothetical protein Mrad2831_1162 [Methylobacterium radiotolerans JCM 2831]GEN00376.1 hypothetical protein MRA01_49150 [Methylobacterium radiotolerans]